MNTFNWYNMFALQITAFGIDYHPPLHSPYNINKTTFSKTPRCPTVAVSCIYFFLSKKKKTGLPADSWPKQVQFQRGLDSWLFRCVSSCRGPWETGRPGWLRCRWPGRGESPPTQIPCLTRGMPLWWEKQNNEIGKRDVKERERKSKNHSKLEPRNRFLSKL